MMSVMVFALLLAWHDFDCAGWADMSLGFPLGLSQEQSPPSCPIDREAALRLPPEVCTANFREGIVWIRSL